MRLGVRGDAAPVADAVAAVDAGREPGPSFELVEAAAAGVPSPEAEPVPDADADAETGTGTDVDVLVAVGEAALTALAAAPPAVPVLPVAADLGRHAVAPDRLADALRALAGGGHRTVAHPVLAARVGDESARALLDVTLMTSEPARISEYAVRADGERVDAVRADGVVVATPAGSDGYARDAGGPLLGPGTGVCVVPVAPFATRTDSWVLAPPVGLSVERDDGPVALYVDGTEVRPLVHGDAVEVRVADGVEFVRVPGAGTSGPE